MTFFSIIWSLAVFLFLYNLILFFIILFNNRKKLYSSDKIKKYPKVCIILPFKNEEETLSRSLKSLTNLDYPKDKLEIFAIDGNSTDDSFNIAKSFENNQIKAFNYKEDKGKYSALNFGISKTDAEIIGCLDADSIVDSSSLKKIISYFEDDKTAAVASAPKIYKPKTIFQHIIQIEFLIEVFRKKVLSLLDSMIIIPGPYSFFRKDILEKIGGFKEAHKTEDIEITMRLQKHNFKLKSALDVSVYTIGKKTFKELYIQRLRWTTGYFKNLYSYKTLFQKKYGDLAILLSIKLLSLSLMVTFVSYGIFNIFSNLLFRLQKLFAINFDFISLINLNFNPLFINITPFIILNLIIVLLILTTIFLSKKFSFDKNSTLIGILLFLPFYFWLMIIWLISSLYSIIFKKKIIWK